MLNTLNINLKTDIKNDRPTALGIKLMSQDKNNNQFILRFTNGGEPVTLDDTYTVEILTKFQNSGASRLTSAIVRQDYATWEFDTAYITQDERVDNFVYVRKAGSLVVSADANAFYFDVGLSEIDKDAGRVAEVYDENYQKYLDEFKDNVDFEEIAQAEQARKEAELLREENYNQKVDTAIVEADVVSKVDSKVTELTPQINNLTAQLAQNAEQADTNSNSVLRNYLEIARPKGDRKPLVTFVDDDGSLKIFTELLPVFVEKNVPLVVAIIGNSTVANDNQHIEQLKYYKENHGLEIAWHSQLHENLSTYTESQLEGDFKLARVFSNKHNLEVDNIVYPYGGVNSAVEKIASKHFKSGIGASGGLNKNYPMRMYNITRTAFGSYTNGINTLADYKAQVDEAVANNGWLIYMTHIWHEEHTEEQQQILRDLIDYIKSLNVDIVTLKEGVRQKGVALETGNRNGEHFIVNPDGTITSNSAITYLSTKTVSGSTPITDFEKGKITVNEFYSYAGVGFPSSTGGLITYRGKQHDTLSYQQWIPLTSGKVYRRGCKGDLTWRDWEQLATMSDINAAVPPFTSLNAYSASALIEEFPNNKITTFAVNASGGAGFPNNTAGLVHTYRFQSRGWSYQIFHQHNSHNMFKRFAYQADGNWSEWKQIQIV